MPPIPKAAFERCFFLALDVYDGRVTEKDAVTEAAALGMNETSARDTIYVVRCMAEGRRYARGLSAPQTEFVLRTINGTLGKIRFESALKALAGHIEYYEGVRSGTLHTLRGVLTKFEALREPSADLEAHLVRENAALAIALARSPADRTARLAASDPMPKTTNVTATVYLRNPDVVAEVLLRAGDTCEGCARPAPFLRLSNGLPYLEVHHRHRLADGGPDTVANAIALCPNCHREAHHGVGWARFGP